MISKCMKLFILVAFCFVLNKKQRPGTVTYSDSRLGVRPLKRGFSNFIDIPSFLFRNYLSENGAVLTVIQDMMIPCEEDE